MVVVMVMMWVSKGCVPTVPFPFLSCGNWHAPARAPSEHEPWFAALVLWVLPHRGTSASLVSVLLFRDRESGMVRDRSSSLGALTPVVPPGASGWFHPSPPTRIV